MYKGILFFVFIFYSVLIFGQTPGLIIKRAEGGGSLILDPNQDGYASYLSTGYISNDYDPTETELPFIPIVRPDPSNDPVIGPGGMYNDIVGTDASGENAIFSCLVGNYLFFRFRLDGYAPNSKTYAIFIDTDGKFGFTGPDADEDAVVGNPGFELEISLHTNFTVSAYDINGTSTAPLLITSYDYETNCQKSIAYTTNSSNPDYFYDYFVDINDLPINSGTTLRYVGITTMNPNEAISSNAQSDVGGTSSGSNLDNVFIDLIEGQTPTVPGEEVLDRSECPAITGPILTGATTVSGTSNEAVGTVIRVFVNDVYRGSTITSGSTWTVTVSALSSGNTVTASAQAPDLGESSASCNATIVGQECGAKVSNATINNKGVCGIAGSAVPGALMKLYDSNMNLIMANPANPVADGTGTFVWSCNGNINNCTSGGPCMADGRYYLTQTPPGQCESSGIWLCLNTTGTTATPTINTPITTSSLTITGTGVANARVYLYTEDGSLIGSAVVAAGGTWSITPTVGLTNCLGIYANQLSSTVTNCISANTALVYVQGNIQAVAPVIDGADCIPSASLPLSGISGFSTEASGTVIRVYDNATHLQIGGLAYVGADGSWSLSGVSISAGTTIYATATDLAHCRQTSAPSALVTVTTQTGVGSLAITTSPIIENVTTQIQGSGGIVGATVYLYLDEFDLLGSGTVGSGGSWSVTVTSGQLFAGSYVYATQKSGTNCESSFSAGVQVQCQAPSTSFALSTVQTGWCEQDYGRIVINPTEEGVIYTPVYTSNATGGYSFLGTGGSDTLTTFGLSADPTTFKIKATKISGISCEAISTSTVDINMYLNPSNKTLSATGTNICTGQTVTITVQNFDPTASYSLQNATTGGTISSSQVVNGSNLELTTGALYDAVTLQVQAEKLYLSGTVSCTAIMSTTYPVTLSGPQTNQPVYADDEILCSSGSTNINVTTYNDGDTYRIYRASDNQLIGTSYIGNGGTYSVSTGTITVTTSYYITINDGGGCGEVRLPDEVTVQVSQISLTTDQVNDVSCFGDTDGSIYISVSGQVLSPTYSWSHSKTSQDVTNLAPGHYIVTVTDGGYCSFQEEFDILEPDELSVVATTTQNDNGVPGGGGIINVIISGGTSDYDLSWSGPENGSLNIGSSTDYNISNLIQGNYYIQIVDANGCSTSGTAHIGDASSLIINATVTPVSCYGGSDGEIDLHVGPAGSSYTVDWEFNGWEEPDTDSEDQTGFSAGSYTVVVTNSITGNHDTVSFDVSEPLAPLSVSETITQITCYGYADGQIIIETTGGTAPYPIAWTGPDGFSSSNDTISNLEPGTYYLTLTDDAGCQYQEEFTITQYDPISISLLPTHVTTFGGSNGKVKSIVSGGTGTFIYLWDTGSTLDSIYNLSAGSYKLDVSDGSCTTFSEIIVSQPVNTISSCQYLIGDSFSSATGYSGNNLSTGQLGWVTDWTESGGNTPSTEPIGIISLTQTGISGYALAFGNLSGNGDEIDPAVSITRDVDLSQFDYSTARLKFNYYINGGGNNDEGTFAIQIENDGSVYTYDLNTTASGTFDKLLTVNSGSTSFTITLSVYTPNNKKVDGYFAIDSLRFELTKDFEATATPDHVTCYDGNDGSVAVVIDATKNGISPYSYHWNNSSTTLNLSGLTSGYYSDTLTDHGGCKIILSNIYVSEPSDSLKASISLVQPTCPGSSNGSISVLGPSNGNGSGYQYQFTNSTGTIVLQSWSTDNSYDPIGDGTYRAYIRNGDGSCPTLVSGNIVILGEDKVKPTVSCPGTITKASNGSNCVATVSIPAVGTADVSDNCTSDANLIASLTWTSSDGGSGSGQIGNRQFPAGTTTVTYTVTDDSGNSNSCSFNVVVNSDVNVSTFSIAAPDVCLGQDVYVTLGGSLADGTYLVDYQLSGANTGTFIDISMTVAGGTGSGTIIIPAGNLSATGNTVFTISALSRNCNVTSFPDTNDDFMVTALPDAPSGNAIQSFCSGNLPVINNLTIVPSDPSAIIRWYAESSGGSSLAGTTSLVHNETYYASQEINGCESASRFEVTTLVNESPTSSVLSGSTTICSGSSANLVVTITGGTEPYTVVYNNGTSDITVNGYISGNGIVVSPSSTTTYSLVSITDSEGCLSASLSGGATVTVNSSPASALISGNATICSGSGTNLTISITNGTPDYTVIYADQASNEFTLNNFVSGSQVAVSPGTTTSYHLVSVSDANGCTAPALNGNPTVTVWASPTAASITLTTTTICSGENSALRVNITGGTSPYNLVYYDDPGGVNVTVNNYVSGQDIPITPAVSGYYEIVSVTDAQGCSTSNLSGTPNITVNSGSGSAVLSGDAEICQGQSTPVSVAISGGTSPYQLIYSDGSSNFSVNNYASGANITVAPFNTTTYSIVSVSDVNGCYGTGNSGSALVTIDPSPSLTLGSNPEACLGITSADLTFSNVQNSPDEYSISWGALALSEGFTDVSGQALGSSPIAIALPVDVPANSYSGTLTVTNTSTSCSSSVYSFSVLVQNCFSITGQPASEEVCSGEDASFTVTTDASAPTFQWQEDNGSGWSDLLGETTDNLILSSVGIGLSGNSYRCQVTEGAVTLTSDAANLTVNALPDNSYTLSDPDICFGAPALITVSGSENGVEYQLRLNSDNSLVEAPVTGTGSNINVVVDPGPSASTVYNLLAITPAGCTAVLTDLSTVTVLVPELVVTVNNNPKCPDLLSSLGFDANSLTYDAGSSAIGFTITRNSPLATSWYFEYYLTISGSTLDGDILQPAQGTAGSPVAIAVGLADDSYELVFYVVNQPGTLITATLNIVNVSAGGCVETSTANHSKDQIVSPMPVIGNFN